MAADTSSPTTPLSGLVKKFTEKRTAPAVPPPASQPVAQPTAQPVAAPAAQAIGQPVATAVNRDAAAKKAAARKVSPPLASLPAPKASGPLRILVVDDDWDNNSPDARGRLTASDEIFRTLVAAAVGGDAAAWSVVIAERYKDGPGFERLRDYNVVLWYTGASHGADPNGVSTLSREDEKTVRRYLEETGGSFILVSPGYVNNLSYATSWTGSPHPFLKEVVGINGFFGFVQRFTAGNVQAHDGSRYTVAEKGAVTPNFSAVNPDGAAIVFTSTLDPKKTAEGPVPVATAHPFGGGRFVYVGFTFENIPDAERAKAFKLLLDAATGPRAAVVAGTPRVTPSVLQRETAVQRIVEPPPPGPAPLQLTVSGVRVGVQTVTWDRVLEAKYNVDRVARDGTGISIAVNITTRQVEDHALVEPGTVYRVSAVQPDGRTGVAEIIFSNPVVPTAPTSLSATQIAPDTLRLSFGASPDSGLQGYRVTVSSAPGAVKFFPINRPAGVAVTSVQTVNVEFNGLPIGPARFGIVPQYDGKLASLETPFDANVDKWSGRYRVVLLGFRAADQTKDEDIFGGDGAGDEIIIGAYRALVPRAAGTAPVRQGIVWSPVFGDNGRFPGRVRAGSATPTGGIRERDVVPSDAQIVAQPGVATSTNNFPLLLWEGRLEHGGPRLALGLGAFEWDSADAASSSSRWSNWWTSPDGDRMTADETRNRTSYVESRIIINPRLFSAQSIDYTMAPGKTRPLSGRYDLPARTTNVVAIRSYPEGLVLSHENLEATLGARTAMIMGFNWRMSSYSSVGDNVLHNSWYVAYLQIERMPD